ncbi:hypothetical protein [Sphingomonas sp. ERG5]|uniref:hypothetical protein n=1 Tax=Sphingomonas sp. ERG5 TaxID=1381597 RepID=UPI000A52FFAF
MVAGRTIVGVALGALVAAGFAVAPALGAPEAPNRAEKRPIAMRGIGSFTPASADPRLAAVLARSGLDATSFRFTPSESRRNISRAVTVAVRARSTRSALDAERAAITPIQPSVSLAPIAYNLGVSVGWKRFALSGEVARVDLAALPGSRESVDLGISYTGRRFSGRVKAVADRPLANSPKLVEDAPAYALDVGGSYSLTRNLDVTAGVRYKSEAERLPRVADERRDSQAVYIGTAFRF